jgi:glucose/arabinose dehydrogenase
MIVRYTADDPASNAPGFSAPEAILRVVQPYANHNGGMVLFGPDNMLYIGMGDGGSAGDPENRAQNLRELLGKLLRIDVEGTAGRSSAEGVTYAIPRDNPFQYPGDSPSDSKLIHYPQIWQWGLRNPWRFSFDRETGDLWIGDVGQSDWEEIDFAARRSGAGVNWGWNHYEGTHPYPPGAEARTGDYTMPVVEYDRAAGKSVTGGYVYRGAAEGELAGTYFYADFVDGRIWGLQRAASGTRTRLLLDNDYSIASFGEDDEGELYVVDYSGGGIYRVVAE